MSILIYNKSSGSVRILNKDHARFNKGKSQNAVTLCSKASKYQREQLRCQHVEFKVLEKVPLSRYQTYSEIWGLRGYIYRLSLNYSYSCIKYVVLLF